MNKSIARKITLLARKSQRHIGEALKKYDISAAEQPFFMALDSDECLTQEELTAIVCVDKAATARAVKSLEQKGYLKRIQDKNDRRQNRVFATAKAKAIMEDVKEELHSFNDLLTSGIEPDKIDSIYESLIKMEENFENILKNDGLREEHHDAS